MRGLMWALKNSFLLSLSTMYLSLDRKKTRLETVLHALSMCGSQRSSSYCLLLYLTDGVPTLGEISPRVELD